MEAGIKAALEYAAARALIAAFGIMPRSIAYPAAEILASVGCRLARRQYRAGTRNLELAMPQLGPAERKAILQGVFSNLGRLLVEFTHFPDLNRSNIANVVEYEGYEHFLEAQRRGKGVIFLTGHVGAWELSSYAHSIYGHPLKFTVRPIDNPYVHNLIHRYRTLGGNVAIERRNAGREILKALRANETVGVLVDQNTTRAEGVFVDFFGIPAATTPSVATFALRTGAAVVPGFLIWDRAARKHRLKFDPPVDLVQTGDHAKDIEENTRRFNQILEGYVRRYPDQWLWIHRRWKTRPEGEASLYERL